MFVGRSAKIQRTERRIKWEWRYDAIWCIKKIMRSVHWSAAYMQCVEKPFRCSSFSAKYIQSTSRPLAFTITYDVTSSTRSFQLVNDEILKTAKSENVQHSQLIDDCQWKWAHFDFAKKSLKSFENGCNGWQVHRLCHNFSAIFEYTHHKWVVLKLWNIYRLRALLSKWFDAALCYWKLKSSALLFYSFQHNETQWIDNPDDKAMHFSNLCFGIEQNGMEWNWIESWVHFHDIFVINFNIECSFACVCMCVR